MRGKRWSDEEIALLRENPSVPARDLATRLGRSEKAVLRMLTKRGIYKSKRTWWQERTGRDFTPIEASYIAGIFDGEGSIHYEGKRNPMHFFTISITNTFKPLLDWIQERVGGRVIEHKFVSKRGKRVWVLHLHRIRDVYSFIEQIYHYLIVKRKPAEILMELYHRRLDRLRFRPIDPEDLKLAEELHKLTRRGKPSPE